LRYQFSQLSLMILTSLLVVAQSVFQIANIYRGLIWFFLPSSLVIVNDVFAYIFGMHFGRTRLLKLSPTKTVEGFVGSSFVTLLWAVAAATVLQRFPVMTCPQSELELWPFAMWKQLDCEQSTTFEFREYALPRLIWRLTGVESIVATPMQWHSLVLGLFAAFFAPFGGFFASGFKRAIRVKDFGDSIPGHRGITDRFDCQIIMGMFTYMYFKTFIRRSIRVSDVMSTILLLPREDQLRVFTTLRDHLERSGLLGIY